MSPQGRTNCSNFWGCCEQIASSHLLIPLGIALTTQSATLPKVSQPMTHWDCGRESRPLGQCRTTLRGQSSRAPLEVGWGCHGLHPSWTSPSVQTCFPSTLFHGILPNEHPIHYIVSQSVSWKIQPMTGCMEERERKGLGIEQREQKVMSIWSKYK